MNKMTATLLLIVFYFMTSATISQAFDVTANAPPQPKLTVFSYNTGGDSTLDIVEGVKSYVQCESPPTVPNDVVILTIYKDSENKNCYIQGVHICRVDVTFSRSDNRAGNWWCRATWRGSEYDTRDQQNVVDVHFNARTVIMTKPFPPLVTEGSRVSLTCETDSANPTAVITWAQNGAAISNHDRYTITALEEKGEFNANNRISTLSFSATLYDNDKWFDCRLLDQDHYITSQPSTLYVQGKLTPPTQAPQRPITTTSTAAPTTTTLTSSTALSSASSQGTTSSTPSSIPSSTPSSAPSSASTPPEIQTSIENAAMMTTVPSGSSMESSNAGLIGGAAGVVVGLILVVVVGIVVFVVLRKRKSAKTPDSDDQEIPAIPSTNAHPAGNGETSFFFGSEQQPLNAAPKPTEKPISQEKRSHFASRLAKTAKDLEDRGLAPGAPRTDPGPHDPDEKDPDPTNVENLYAKPDLSSKQKNGAGAKPAVEAKPPQKPVVPIKRFPDEKNEPNKRNEQDNVTGPHDPDEHDPDPKDVENLYAKPDLSSKQKNGAGAKPAVEAKPPQKPDVPIKRFPEEKNEQKEQDAVTGLTNSSRDSTSKPERASPKIPADKANEKPAAKAKEKPKPSVAIKPVAKVPDKYKAKKPAPSAVPQAKVGLPTTPSTQDDERHEYYNTADITASRSARQYQIPEDDSQTYAEVLPTMQQPRLDQADPVADTEYSAVQFRPDGRRNDDSDSD